MEEQKGRGSRAARTGLDADIGRAVREVLRLSPEVHTMLARRVGVGVTDLLALDHLSLAPSPEGVVSLGRRLGVTSASATVLVARLVGAGHVERSPHPSDGRRTVLHLTDTARDDVRDALDPLLVDLAELVGRLDQAEARAVAGFLTDLAEVLRRFADGSEERSQPAHRG